MIQQWCNYFDVCGGCSLQHLEYSVQLENKRKFLSAVIKFGDVKVFSGKNFGYRNRMDFIFHSAGLGLRRKRNWKSIIDIKHCAIADERINLLLAELRDFFRVVDFFDVEKNTGTFRYAVIRTPQNSSSISFVLNSDSSRLNDAVERIKQFSGMTSADSVLVTYVPAGTDESISSDFFVIKGKDVLVESFLGKEFVYSVQGFFQNNTEIAQKMQEYCNNLLKQYSTKDFFLLDLYGGVGTFGIINADLFRGVTIIENDQNCINAAKINIEKSGVSNAQAIVLDAKNLKNLDLLQHLFVIVDPPRTGMHLKTIEELNRIKPKVIIYISCNPEQLGKELPKFKNYSIKSAALFDMFPQTQHSEAIIELVRNDIN